MIIFADGGSALDTLLSKGFVIFHILSGERTSQKEGTAGDRMLESEQAEGK